VAERLYHSRLIHNLWIRHEYGGSYQHRLVASSGASSQWTSTEDLAELRIGSMLYIGLPGHLGDRVIEGAEMVRVPAEQEHQGCIVEEGGPLGTHTGEVCMHGGEPPHDRDPRTCP
jgi:hypothetical protein